MMAHQTKQYPVDSVVERAITHCGGKPNDLIFRIFSATGEKPTRQALNRWRNRCAFSREMLMPVHKITRIPMAELIYAMNNPRDVAKESKQLQKKDDNI
jgi:hypothetical protein